MAFRFVGVRLKIASLVERNSHKKCIDIRHIGSNFYPVAMPRISLLFATMRLDKLCIDHDLPPKGGHSHKDRVYGPSLMWIRMTEVSPSISFPGLVDDG